MKLLKKLLLVLLILFAIAQAFRPAKDNTSNNTTNDISHSYPVPDDVKTILAKGCNDCHSNKTIYPWYASVQPVAWWLEDHIDEGKQKLNFNEFLRYPIARQYKKLEQCMDEVKEGDMPLSSYTIIHRNAILTDAEKQKLYDWCTNVRDTIKARYPADSLVIKRKK
ncbi:MAG: hypothetical protein NVSMB63_07980 [Sediminibacterium sp.]